MFKLTLLFAIHTAAFAAERVGDLNSFRGFCDQESCHATVRSSKDFELEVGNGFDHDTSSYTHEEGDIIHPLNTAPSVGVTVLSFNTSGNILREKTCFPKTLIPQVRCSCGHLDLPFGQEESHWDTPESSSVVGRGAYEGNFAECANGHDPITNIKVMVHPDASKEPFKMFKLDPIVRRGVVKTNLGTSKLSEAETINDGLSFQTLSPSDQTIDPSKWYLADGSEVVAGTAELESPEFCGFFYEDGSYANPSKDSIISYVQANFNSKCDSSVPLQSIVQMPAEPSTIDTGVSIKDREWWNTAPSKMLVRGTVIKTINVPVTRPLSSGCNHGRKCHAMIEDHEGPTNVAVAFGNKVAFIRTYNNKIHFDVPPNYATVAVGHGDNTHHHHVGTASAARLLLEKKPEVKTVTVEKTNRTYEILFWSGTVVAAIATVTVLFVKRHTIKSGALYIKSKLLRAKTKDQLPMNENDLPKTRPFNQPRNVLSAGMGKKV